MAAHFRHDDNNGNAHDDGVDGDDDFDNRDDDEDEDGNDDNNDDDGGGGGGGEDARTPGFLWRAIRLRRSLSLSVTSVTSAPVCFSLPTGFFRCSLPSRMFLGRQS